MKKKAGICISKCLKSAAKNRRANQTARANLTAPTVHSGHCNTAYHTIMKVDRLFVHTKTAYIIPKKMDKLCIHPAFVTYWKTRVLCSHFCDILCK